MLSVGGDIDKKSNHGVSCLHLACAAGKLTMVKYLIETLGMKTDEQTKSTDKQLIHVATKSGDLDVVKYLVEV